MLELFTGSVTRLKAEAIQKELLIARRDKRKEQEAVDRLLSFIMSMDPRLDPYMELTFRHEVLHLVLQLESLKDYIAKEKHKIERNYRKVKTIIRNILRKYWFLRIRFAGREIGNLYDYSLVTMPVPPTTEPTDEYFVIYNYAKVHQWGGVCVDCLP